MTTKITVLGLNRIGESLAAALQSREGLLVTGFDSDPEAASQVRARGHVRRTDWNLLNAVEGAELVIIALPLSEQRETLAAIAPEIRPGGVVASLTPLLAPVLGWAQEFLSAADGRHFVACHPILHPDHWQPPHIGGAQAVRPDLFARGLWVLAPAPDSAPEAVKLLADLTHLLGAAPYYMDPAEHDGVMAVTEAVPGLLAMALMQAAAASSGWTEIRKAADQNFASGAAALAEADPASLVLNRDNVLRFLDAVTGELAALREKIAAGSAPRLEEALAETAARRAEWLAERSRGEAGLAASGPAVPSAGENMSRLLFGNWLSRRGDKK